MGYCTNEEVETKFIKRIVEWGGKPLVYAELIYTEIFQKTGLELKAAIQAAKRKRN